MIEHYSGLVAQMYDEWFPPHEGYRDGPFYQQRIVERGGPALELGCGTGRLLLPYLEAGLDVEGVDSSSDMLELCRRKAAARGLAPVLHEQRMERLALPRRYATVFVPLATFQHIERREDALAALSRFREHLLPGGELIVTLFTPWDDLGAKGEWRLRRVGQRADGATIVLSEAIVSDRVEQLQVWHVRYDVYRNGKLAGSELHVAQARWYFKAEFALMLERAGFRDIEAFGDFEDRTAPIASDMIFLARA